MASLHIKYSIFLLVLLFSGFAIAQQGNYNRLSLELTTGIHIPLKPAAGIARAKYVGFKQFELGARYMFSEKFGIKGHYAYNNFSDPNNSSQGILFNRFGLEGVVNIGKLLNVNYNIRDKVGMLVHAGPGITFAIPESNENVDHMGNLIVGLTGQIRLSERFALLGDLSHISNFSQQYGYNGILLGANNNSNTGSFLNVSIGLMYSIGSKRYHSDWY